MKTADDHFQRRLFDRFGIELTRKEIGKLVYMIETSKIPTISTYAQGASLNYLVKIKGRMVIVVYNHHRHYLISALKPDGNHENPSQIPEL